MCLLFRCLRERTCLPFQCLRARTCLLFRCLRERTCLPFQCLRARTSRLTGLRCPACPPRPASGVCSARPPRRRYSESAHSLCWAQSNRWGCPWPRLCCETPVKYQKCNNMGTRHSTWCRHRFICGQSEINPQQCAIVRFFL